MRTVVGVFDSVQDVERALSGLYSLGVRNDQISVVSRDTRAGHERQVAGDEQRDPVQTGAFALSGGAVGGVVGILAGMGALGSLAIPGIGPIIAAGTIGSLLAGTAVGAGVGAAAGGLIGALTSQGVPEEHAHVYAESVRRGSTLVMVQAEDELAGSVESVLRQSNAVDVQRRRGEWEQGGWNRFDPAGEPLNPGEEWRDSSKLGTGAGAATGAATGAAIGSAGGPVGTVIGGIAGAATGGATGAAGDVAGEKVEDEREKRDRRDHDM